MRKSIIAGNWKMNLTLSEALNYLSDLEGKLENTGLEKTSVYLFPSHVLLPGFLANRRDNRILVGAQNCHHEVKGAYTGEVSAPMLNSVGAEAIIIGHSERRQYFREDNQTLARKVDLALHYGMAPFYCCGESLDERKSNRQKQIVRQQIQEGLFHLEEGEMEKVVIAYEPVWAIGTGETASPEQAEEMHAYIREQVNEEYGIQIAEKLRILYGGSVKPNNAHELFQQNDIDGGLIGGASLKTGDFYHIIETAD